MTSEQRLDRLERIAKLMASAGLRTRKEFREHLRGHDEQIVMLINAQIKSEEAFAGLAESQAHTDRKFDALIDIIRKREDSDN